MQSIGKIIKVVHVLVFFNNQQSGCAAATTPAQLSTLATLSKSQAVAATATMAARVV